MSKQIIKTLQDHGGTIMYHEKILDFNNDDINAAIRCLAKNGYIGSVVLPGGTQIGITLNHKARHPKEFRRIEFLHYLKLHWIAIIALIISIVSFIRTI